MLLSVNTIRPINSNNYSNKSQPTFGSTEKIAHFAMNASYAPVAIQGFLENSNPTIPLVALKLILIDVVDASCGKLSDLTRSKKPLNALA